MKKIFFLAIVTLALTSCESNDNPDFSSGSVQITATIAGTNNTRASDQSWAENDRIGISSTIGTDNPQEGPYTNLEYTLKYISEGNGVFEGTPIYFYKPMTLTAYYPFTGESGKVPNDNGIIEANTSADNQTAENQPKIDFLWDSKTGIDQKDFSAKEPTVKFEFSHKMSRLVFAFKGSPEVVENDIVIAPEVKVSDMVRYEIEGLVLDGTFDTATGICAADDEGNDEKITITLEKESVKEKVDQSPLIVFPQKPGNTKVKLHVYTDELNRPDALQHYVCTLTFDKGELKPGYSYKYTIQISKVGLRLAEMSIVDWNSEREVNLTATIDDNVTEDEQK